MRLGHPGSVAQWCLFVRSWHFGSFLATTWAIGPKDRDSTPKRAGQDWGAEDSCNLAEMWILDTEEEWGARPNYTILYTMLYLSEVRDLSYLSLKLSERQSITLFLQVGLPAGCVAVAKWSRVFGFGFFVRVLFCPCTASPGKSHHEAWRYWLWGHCEARWWMDQHTQ